MAYERAVKAANAAVDGSSIDLAAAPAPPLAAETRRLYAADWDSFARWCRDHAVSSLPAGADVVAAFLSSLADTHRPGSLRRRLAAIVHAHRSAGHPPPDSPAVRTALRACPVHDRQPATSRVTQTQLVRAAALVH